MDLREIPARRLPAFVLVLAALATGCVGPRDDLDVGPRDDLEAVALQASRAGTAAGDASRPGSAAGLDAGSRVAERYYYVAKYEATLRQRQVAETVARRAVPRMVARAKKRGAQVTRFLAVRTKSDARAQTATSVILWDTRTEEIVGNDVYDLNSTPTRGAAVKFETYTAEYVGAEG